MSQNPPHNPLADMLKQFPPDIQNKFINSDKQVAVQELDVTPKAQRVAGNRPMNQPSVASGSAQEQNQVLANLTNMAMGVDTIFGGNPNIVSTPLLAPPSPPEYNPLHEEAVEPLPIQTRKVRVIKTHPILETLRNKLGITSNKLKKTKPIDGLVYGFLKLNSRETSLIGELINKDTPIEDISPINLDTYVKAAKLSIALKTIDDVPLYDVVGLDTSSFMVDNILNPPQDLMKEAASIFMSTILLDATDEDAFLDTLDKSYESLFGDVSFWNLDEDVVAYSCPKCGRLEKEVLQFIDGKEVPYFCKYDGNILDRMEVLDDNASPLSLKKPKMTKS